MQIFPAFLFFVKLWGVPVCPYPSGLRLRHLSQLHDGSAGEASFNVIDIKPYEYIKNKEYNNKPNVVKLSAYFITHAVFWVCLLSWEFI